MTSLSVATAASGRREPWQDLLIIDVDVHVHETPEALAPYCEKPWRLALENLKNIPENYLDQPGFSPRADYMAPFPGGYEKRFVLDPASMRQELDALSVDIGILFPDNLLRLALLPQADYAAAVAAAYNAYLMEQWADPDRGLLACVTAAPQDPVKAAAEIRRYADQPGVIGVYLPSAGVSPLWGHRMYDPIYEAAQEVGLPVLLHGAVVVHPVFPCQLEQFDTYLARHTFGHTLGMMANLVSMVTTGVPVRYPDMKICFAEAGLAWVPFIAMRLDKEYNMRRRDVPFLTERPSEYVKRMYFATQPVEEPKDLGKLEEIIDLFDGDDACMFASDWPHPDFDHPRRVAQMLRNEELRAKVMGLNAKAFFGLDEQGRRASG
jgi:predicted TIM-barrel fold metal-dependent hydrolase